MATLIARSKHQLTLSYDALAVLVLLRFDGSTFGSIQV